MRYAMKNYFVALAFMAVLLPVACACGTPEPARSGDGDPLPGNPGAKSYKNPVFREFLVADPTVIRAEDGNFTSMRPRAERTTSPSCARPTW